MVGGGRESQEIVSDENRGIHLFWFINKRSLCVNDTAKLKANVRGLASSRPQSRSPT